VQYSSGITTPTHLLQHAWVHKHVEGHREQGTAQTPAATLTLTTTSTCQVTKEPPCCTQQTPHCISSTRQQLVELVCGLCCEGIDAPCCMHCAVLLDQGGELCCRIGTKCGN
jgi:hypothetical protein